MINSAMEWLRNFLSVLRNYSDTAMYGFIRSWYNDCRGSYGTNQNNTGLGDIIGSLGPLGLMAALFLVIALLFVLFRRKRKSFIGGLSALLSVGFSAAWYMLWLKVGFDRHFFTDAGQQMLTVVLAVMLILALLFFLIIVARPGKKKAAETEAAEKKAPEPPKPAVTASTDDMDAKTTQLHKEMNDLERQLEAVRLRRKALEERNSGRTPPAGPKNDTLPSDAQKATVSSFDNMTAPPSSGA